MFGVLLFGKNLCDVPPPPGSAKKPSIFPDKKSPLGDSPVTKTLKQQKTTQCLVQKNIHSKKWVYLCLV